MIKNVYTVYDSKALVYGNPFYSVNDQVALRDFSQAAGDPGSLISKAPVDYTLFKIGSYDDTTGLFDVLPVHVNLGLASQFTHNEV
ncbi:MAG: nonstructural protein [Microviridae sp.]|nr:MAG: nonstructural protein [Microviridae sp.]